MAEMIENKNYYEEKKETRRICYKTAIKKDDFKLEYDYETPQEERRRLLLESQKRSRENAVNAARCLLFDNFLSEDEEEVMEVESYKCKTTMYKHKRACRAMMSEWMLEPPENFMEDWIMVPCPVGKRAILVAGKGVTKAYDRRGNKIRTFQSALPGGNFKGMRSHFTILDCIWIRESNTYYVLDVMAWAKQPTTNWEAELRHFWINTHLTEIEALNTRNLDINEYPILPLPSISCNSDLSVTLTAISSQFLLDGLLFYHRNGHYIFGRSPLVTWLKHFMLTEVLGIFVPSPLNEKPDGYIDYKHFIYQTTKNKKQKEYFCSYFGIEKNC